VARRPEHHPVPRRLAESGVRRLIVLPDVRLDFDDPSDPPTRGIVADESCADQAACGLERRPRQDGAVENAQLKV